MTMQYSLEGRCLMPHACVSPDCPCTPLRDFHAIDEQRQIPDVFHIMEWPRHDIMVESYSVTYSWGAKA